MPEQWLDIPEGGEILCVHEQYDRPTLWARVDANAPIKKRRITLRTTGFAVTSEEKYIGTFLLSGGTFVGHVFELESQ